MSAKPAVAQSSHRPTRTRSNLDWQELAACVDSNPNIFHDPERYADALTVCRSCPVQAPCRELGRGQGAGVWGGRVQGGRATRGLGEFMLQPHGTAAAYKRHLRAGETPCAPCTEANSAYNRRMA